VTARVDTDPAQRRLAAGILSLAEQIGTEVRAECVETLGEFALLSQLGCVSVQGLAVADAMPFEETIAWMDMQAARIADAPIPRRTAT
jgi:diguanylate cyclase